MIGRRATDLYLTVGVPPTLRIDNELHPLSELSLSEEDMQVMLADMLTSRQRREFDANMELNLALDMGADGRFRVNVMRQRQNTGMVIRHITSKIPSFAQLRLPAVIEALAKEKRGLIIVCGVTASGKSTSLASIVDYRNQHIGGHIITIEDPIEFYHDHKRAIITQREVGIDTNSYGVALRNALRQKPDVILVGEIRETDVMEQALTASETGHLCLATLHANNSSQAIDRIINLFPEERHLQARSALASNLRAIVAQRLVRSVDGGLVVAIEVLLNEALIKELIMKGDGPRIKEVMANNSAAGMVVFDQSIFRLFVDGVIDEKTAITEADVPGDMKMRIQQYRMSGSEGMSVDTSRLSL